MASDAEAKNIFWSSLQWFKNLKQKYLAKSPLEKWRFVRGINMSIAGTIGCEFAEDGYGFSLRTLLPAFVILDYILFAIYTLYYFRNDPIQGLMATPAIALIFPCIVFYVRILVPSTRKHIRHLYDFAGDSIYANSDSTPKNYLICDQLAVNLFSKSVKINLLIWFSLYLTACAPLYNIFFNSTDDYGNQFIIPIILPFIDPFTQRGFYINLANQIFICLIGVLGLPTIELFTSIMINTISVSAAVIANAFVEFGERINNEDQFSAEYNWKFRNILVQIMDYDRFSSDYVDLFYWKLLIQPILLVYAIIYLIFVYIVRLTSASIGSSACCYIQLLILCDAGKTVDDADNLILDALNQFPFYLLSTDKQRLFGLLLKRNQKKAKLKMGPFAELNYETATKLTKMMYTYIMCMLKARG